VVEYNSSIYNPKGLDVNDLKAYFDKHGSFKGYGKEGSEILLENHNQILENPCDFLVLASVVKSVNAGNAEKVQAKCIVEGANGPVTFKAEEILLKRGKTVIPDLLINSGGVTVSYFEWLKNLSHVSPGKMRKKHEENVYRLLLQKIGESKQKAPEGAKELDIVYSGLEEFMSTAVQQVWKFKTANNFILRDACFVLALRRVYEHMK